MYIDYTLAKRLQSDWLYSMQLEAGADEVPPTEAPGPPNNPEAPPKPAMPRPVAPEIPTH